VKKKKELLRLIEDLGRQLHSVQSRVQKLESEVQEMRIQPVQPVFPIYPVQLNEPRCKVCNIRHSDMTGYVCHLSECPHAVTVTCGRGEDVVTISGNKP